jgi:hypothetical protein
MIIIGSKNISKLDLSNLNLTEFPVEVLSLKNLRKLNLSNNKISVIPSTIENLKNLELIDLSNNEIKNFYAKICSLKRLKVLNLNNNKIRTIPKQISDLKSLENLQLSSNRIETMPESFSQLDNLQKLNLSKNPLSEFPIQLLKVSNLKYLWLNNLKLNTFPLFEISNSLTNLSGLYCYGRLVRSNNMNEDFLQLSKIKGNSLPKLNVLKKQYETNKMSDFTNSKPVQKNKIFISYSHSDKKWLEIVQMNLRVLEHDDYEFDLWDDTRIKAGDKWKTEIEQALNLAGIAILIVSTAFLASKFVQNDELPTIFKNAEENKTKILPLIIGHCRFTQHRVLSTFQAVNDPSKPLSSLSDSDQEFQLVQLTNRVEEILKGS